MESVHDKILFDNLSIALTDHCNLKCKMCFIWKNTGLPGLTSLPVIKNFLLQLREFQSSSFNVGIIGGEPLLSEEIFSLLKCLRDFNIPSHLVTNGTLLTKEKAKNLNDSGLCTINLSLDSHLSEIHDRVRGVKGSFIKCLEGFQNIRNVNDDIYINIFCVLMEDTLETSPEMAEWAISELGADKIQFNIIMHPMHSSQIRHDDDWPFGIYNNLWPSRHELIIKTFDRLIEKKRRFKKQIINSLGQLEAFREYMLNPRFFVKKGVCNLYKNLTIHQSDQLTFCQVLEDIKSFVRLDKTTNLREVFYSERYQEIKKRIIECRRNCHQLINCFFDE